MCLQFEYRKLLHNLSTIWGSLPLLYIPLFEAPFLYFIYNYLRPPSSTLPTTIWGSPPLLYLPLFEAPFLYFIYNYLRLPSSTLSTTIWGSLPLLYLQLFEAPFLYFIYNYLRPPFSTLSTTIWGPLHASAAFAGAERLQCIAGRRGKGHAVHSQ